MLTTDDNKHQITDSIEPWEACPNKNMGRWPWYYHATANPTNYGFLCPIPTDSGEPCDECVPMDEYMDHLGSKHIQGNLLCGTIWKCPLPDNDGKRCPISVSLRTDPTAPLTWKDFRKPMRHIFTPAHTYFLGGFPIIWCPLGEWYPEDGEGEIRPLPDTVCRYCREIMKTPFGGSDKELAKHIEDAHPDRL